MDKITNMQNVWDNGAVSDNYSDFDDILEFKKHTGATRVVARRWNYHGQHYETPHAVQLLPDGESLVYATEHFKTLIVLNGDNTIRCEIVPPSLSHDASKIDPSIYRFNKKDPRTARPYLVYPPAPEIAAAMRPPKRAGLGWLALPENWNPDVLYGIEYGCQGDDDGDGEPYVFEFDWNTGALLKAVHMPRTW